MKLHQCVLQTGAAKDKEENLRKINKNEKYAATRPE